MKNLRKRTIIIIVIILLLAGHYFYGYYVGCNIKDNKYFDRVISPDKHYAIEIQYEDIGFLDTDLMIVCENLITKEKVNYIIISTGMFSSDYNFLDVFGIDWYDNRAELTAWVEEDIITTYILDWEMVFSS